MISINSLKTILQKAFTLKFKMLFGFITLNLVLSLLLGFALFQVSNNIYYKSFLNHKKSLGVSVAKSIDGIKFQTFINEKSFLDSEFKRYLGFLRSISKNEEFITWIYALNYDEKKDKLVYAIDASPSGEDTIWMENEYIGVKIFINRSGGISIYYDSVEYDDELEIKSKEKKFYFIIDQNKKEVFLNNQKILSIIETTPLSAETKNGKINKKNLLQNFELNYSNSSNDLEKIPFNLNFSEKSEDRPISVPGWEFVETEEMKTRIKNAIKTCTFHLPNEPEQVAYGTFITMIAPISLNENKCNGAVLFSISVLDVKIFKSKMAITGVTLTIIAFIITLIITYILSTFFTEPITKLAIAVEEVSKGNFETKLNIESKDEFGYISEKFNEMVLNLKKANKDKESFTAIKHELDVAKKIQNSILPKKIPTLENLDIAVNYFPMTQVGGDFYDFHVIDKYKIGIFIADVSGHGVPAAIIASMLKVAFSIQAAFAEDPVRVLSRINKSLLGNVGQNFVSASYVFIDLKENIMKVARAGHPTAFHYSTQSMNLNEFNSKGKIIGLFPDTNSEVIEVSISKGDRIVLYTDGVIEARNNRNEMFGEELFKGYIKKHLQLKANDLAKLIMSDVKSWVGNHINKTDDITILVLDIK